MSFGVHENDMVTIRFSKNKFYDVMAPFFVHDVVALINYRFEKSPLSSDQILETYRQWETTDYSSLYAATNMWDDFAETYVIYTHCLLQAKPWRIAIHKGGTLVCTYQTTLLGEKGKSKMEFMDAFFKVRQ